ncbi:hypothetical protein M885DRAFT_622727 [Pelagophyceae sp. CCMP2097]|nr:hypothetical protein M885DRAFT_622727 [Pelagophyceae sp. CCMP2097]
MRAKLLLAVLVGRWSAAQRTAPRLAANRRRPGAAAPPPGRGRGRRAPQVAVVCPPRENGTAAPAAPADRDKLFDGLPQSRYACEANATHAEPYSMERQISCAAKEATRGCDAVLYSTLFYPPGVKLADPRSRCPAKWTEGKAHGLSLCCVLVVGDASAAALRKQYGSDFSPWKLVEVQSRALSGGVLDGRFLSRFAKILVHRALPSVKYTVFVDYKLKLTHDPRTLIHQTLVLPRRGFVAWRHPCTTKYPPHGFCKGLNAQSKPFLFYEASFLKKLGGNKVQNFTALSMQVDRYAMQPRITFEQYIEGALILRDSSHALGRQLNEAWWREMHREDSSDRDQIAFAYAISTLPELASLFTAGAECPPKWIPHDVSEDVFGVAILSEGAGRKCRALCHWWYNHNLGQVVNRFG